MTIDFKSLENAITSLKDILAQPMDEYRRDGAIQRFEFTFELSWKFIQRVLKEQGLVVASPQQALRSAFKASWITDLDKWLAFQKHRNMASHTYDQKMAEEVFDSAKEFPPHAEALLVFRPSKPRPI